MQIVVEVVNDNLRPTIPPEMADSPMVPLMKDCWHVDPVQRPTFDKIVGRLKILAQQVKPDDNSQHGIPGTTMPKRIGQPLAVAGSE